MPPVKHVMVSDALAQRVRSSMKPHDPLPTERELMAEFDVSRMTVRQAMRSLEARGLVYRVRGSGTYVREDSLVSKSLRLTSFSDDMRERGLEPASELVEARISPADVVLGAATALRLRLTDEVVSLRRRRLAGNIPMALETLALPHSLVPGICERDLTGSLYELLADEYGLRVERARQRIRAIGLAGEDADQLEVPAGSPALRVERIGVDRRGVPIESAVTLYRADRYEFDLTISRDLP
ncbi:MAG: GntR family transcriptional regulator [Actinoallomurus sp.]